MDFPTQLLARGLGSSLHAPHRHQRDAEAWQLSIDIDLELARNTEVNVLIVGPEPGTDELVRRLLPGGLAEAVAGQNAAGENAVGQNAVGQAVAVVRCQDGELRLPAPNVDPGTLVIREVDALSSVEQYQLLQWLDTVPERRPIVSTASTPLLPLVEAGMFSEALFYRLNTIYIDLFE